MADVILKVGSCVLIAFCVSVTLYNHIRLENKLKELETVKETRSLRARRNLGDFDGLHDSFREEINQTILKEINKIWLLVKEQNICETVKSCPPIRNFSSQNITTKDLPRGPQGLQGLQGPPGSPGLPGPPGERGLGLHSPTIREKDLYHSANLTNLKIFKCKFFGHPVPSIEWKSNAKEVNITHEVDEKKAEVSSYLVVYNIKWTDHGIVSCVAKNILGKAEELGYLNVQIPPEIKLLPTTIFANIGSNFNFPLCDVTSNPKANVNWSRGFGIMPSDRTKVNEGSLRINNIQIQDEGFYICSAENFLGKSSAVIQLKSRPLSFHTIPSVILQTMDAFVFVNCSAYGSPKHLRGKLFSFETGREIPSTLSETENTLTVIGNISETGFYRCEFKENSQTIEHTFNVKFFELSSSILSVDQKRQIGEWLMQEYSVGNFNPCITTTVTYTKFSSSCATKKKTLTVLRDGQTVFGGYLDVPFSNSGRHPYSDKAFLYTFKGNGTKLKIGSNVEASCYLQGSNEQNGPCFGVSYLKLSSYGTNRYSNQRYPYGSVNMDIDSYSVNLLTKFLMENTDFAPRSSGSIDALEVFFES